MVIAETSYLSRFKWQYLILDEGHRIKNTSSKLLDSLRRFKVCSLPTNRIAAMLTCIFKPEHKLLLTGTPIQNDMKEMWTLLNYLDPEHFDSSEDFMKDFGELKDQKQVQKLHKVYLGTFMRLNRASNA